jgi:hypothetical protein
MRLLIALGLMAVLGGPVVASDDALDEVNAARARRGLPAYAKDEGLTAAAKAAADFRASHLVAGHVGGNLGDFAFLPVGSTAAAAGCGALDPSWGWGSCCTYDRYTTAGAAVTIGRDGKRYMHLFVR